MREREGEIIRSFPSQGFAKPNVYEHEKCAQSTFAATDRQLKRIAKCFRLAQSSINPRLRIFAEPS